MAQFSESEMMADLAAADAAGDTQLATVIASKIKALRGPQMQASHTTIPPPTADKVARSESAARGALQGASFGFGDEAAGALAAAIPALDREAVGNGQTFGERYRNARDFYRGRNAVAEKSNPGTYLTGQVAGAVAPTLVGAGPANAGAALRSAAGQGALQGAGYSDADSARGLAGDTALGAGVGLAGYGAGQILGKVASATRGAAGRILARAQGKASQQAADESAEAVASAAGRLGGETQKGSRQIENLLRLEQAKSLTPAQVQELAQLRAQGAVQAVEHSVAQNTLESLPQQAATIAARKAELAALQQGAPQAVAARTGEILQPTAKADALSYLKSYAEPVIWAYGGNKVGEALGLDPQDRLALAGAAGIIGGRTRGGKALYARLTKPGNQAALADAMTRIANRLDRARIPVQAGLTSELAAAMAGRGGETR